ncbi:MAG: right-handed parallel beta-helix repeat-containing protein [Aestuariibacter sp.]|nr:right-handed parallel beta-helix repeat-containing protein [Aestuariibacter sp.]
MMKQLLLLFILLSFINPVFAATPQTVNYQGVLTDPAGVPITSTVSIVVRIFDAATVGTELYSESHASVTVTDGVFALALGSGATPTGTFDAATFAGNSTWLELEIDTETQTPRQAFLSVPYALHAEDALTLDGTSASSYDQSAHVSNISNPHSVSAAQAGAATPLDITTHTGVASAHHSKTTSATELTSGTLADARIPAAISRDTELSTHAASPSVHHSRYTNSESVAAILAGDGAGSTLDADLVDGMQANEIIDAAADEVRTPIDSLPFTISASGSYYLTGNLTNGNGIDVNVDNVTIDLMGFTLSGDGTTGDYGIYMNTHNNVTIKNGTIRNFGRAGIYQGSSTGRYNRAIDVRAIGNGTQGGGSSHSGIFLLGTNNHIERCTAADNGGYGLYAGNSSNVNNNTAYNNGSTGISAGTGSTISGNTAYDNGSYGIYGGHGSTITGNTAYNNTGNYGIYGGYGSSISANTVYSNAGWGIYASSGNLVMNNTINSNNTSYTENLGGLRVNNDSRVVGNTLDGNAEYGIYVNNADTVIENNLVSDTFNTGDAGDGVGIYFNSSGCFYANNRATGNTTDYGGSLPAGGGDGGGNASF